MPVTWGSRLSAAVGDKTAKALHAAFGYDTVGQLLLHYPRTYVVRGETSSVKGLRAGERARFRRDGRGATPEPPSLSPRPATRRGRVRRGLRDRRLHDRRLHDRRLRSRAP